MKIVSIKQAGTADTYNMEVAETHNYVVDGGIVSHNCRYVAMKNPIAPPKRKAPEPKPYNPLDTEPVYDRYDWYRRY